MLDAENYFIDRERPLDDIEPTEQMQIKDICRAPNIAMGRQSRARSSHDASTASQFGGCSKLCRHLAGWLDAL